MKRRFFLLMMLIAIIAAPGLYAPKAYAGCVNGGADYIDNDNNAYNSPDNPYAGPWEYKTSSNSYRGDHRYMPYAPVDGKIYEYDWKFPSCSGLYGKVSVYIWDTKFSNEKADYRIIWYGSGTNDVTMRAYLNQRTAPGGWNYVGKTSKAKTGILALVVTSNALGGTGADGARILYSTY
ncbi:hypothetical protein [Bacillus sp. REN3]|uniref:hypothetical protein n=1 Tax=Bacillus sp. REN3 TaxID=2802440 RepID=UPI001AED6F40|nr:hypothetical protein [Bacillus sp. REN3]